MAPLKEVGKVFRKSTKSVLKMNFWKHDWSSKWAVRFRKVYRFSTNFLYQFSIFSIRNFPRAGRKISCANWMDWWRFSSSYRLVSYFEMFSIIWIFSWDVFILSLWVLAVFSGCLLSSFINRIGIGWWERSLKKNLKNPRNMRNCWGRLYYPWPCFILRELLYSWWAQLNIRCPYSYRSWGQSITNNIVI